MSKYVIIKGYDKLYPEKKSQLNYSLPVDNVVPGVGDVWAGWLIVEEVKEVSYQEFFDFDRARRRASRDEMIDNRYDKKKAIELIKKADHIRISGDGETITLYKDE